MSSGSARKERQELAVRRHNETELSKMKEGDRIKFNRGPYSHWGIYVGDGYVVHVTSANGLVSFGVSKSSRGRKGEEKEKGIIKKGKFLDIAGSSKAYINNKLDCILTPLDRSEIVQKALSKLGESDYNILFKNCEHFASWCRYGIKRSEQAEKVLSTICQAVGGPPLLLVTLIAKCFPFPSVIVLFDFELMLKALIGEFFFRCLDFGFDFIIF